MSYAADLSPQQTWEHLESDPQAVLVDVRTRAEWSFVGMPDLAGIGKQVIPLEWTTFPEGAPNPVFVDELRSAVDTDVPVYFLCRSGGRSAAAASAATAAGYARAHNVAEGFEGDLDDQGHRDVNGWKRAGLPWRQG